MDIALVLLVVVLVLGLAVVPLIWWLLCLLEAVRYPDSQWVAADQNKVLYVLLMVFLGVVGTIVYVLVARPELRRVGPPPLAA